MRLKKTIAIILLLPIILIALIPLSATAEDNSTASTEDSAAVIVNSDENITNNTGKKDTSSVSDPSKGPADNNGSNRTSTSAQLTLEPYITGKFWGNEHVTAFDGEIAIGLRNEAGEYVLVDENGNYSGTTTQLYGYPGVASYTNNLMPAIITALPEGTYTVFIRKSDTDYGWDPSITTETEITINNNNVETPVEIHYQAAKELFYYLDTSNREMPEIYTWLYHNSSTKQLTFDLTTNGDTDIYTYNPNDQGAYDKITIKSDHKTIAYLPQESLGIRHGYIPNGNAHFVYNSSSMTKEGEYLVTYTDSWVPMNRATLQISTDAYYVYKHEKKSGDELHNADFYVSSDSIGINEPTGETHPNEVFVLDHHDTYEYNGKTYENVYIVSSEKKSWEEADESTLIHSDNGKFVVLYPEISINYNDRYSNSYYLWEKSGSADEGYLMKNSRSYEYKGSFRQTAPTVAYDGEAGSFSVNSGYENHGIFLENYIDAENFSYDDVTVTFPDTETEKNIFNLKVPAIKKECLFEVDENETFAFDIFSHMYNSETHQYEDNYLDTIYVHNNETVQLSPGIVNGLTEYMLQNGYYRVREKNGAGYKPYLTRTSGTGWTSYGNADEGAYISYDSTTAAEEGSKPVMLFTNVPYGTNLEIAKYTGSAGIDLSDDFTFDIEAKFGNEQLNGTYKTIDNHGNEGTITFSNGKANVNLHFNESIKIQELPAPLEYKVSERPNDKHQCAGVYGSNTNPVSSDTTNWQTDQGAYATLQNDKYVITKSSYAIFTNSRKMTGKINLSKNVTGNDSTDTTDFPFTIKIIMEPNINSTFQNSQPVISVLSGPSSENGITWSGTWAEENIEGSNRQCLTASVNLKDKDEIEIRNLPVGAKYTIEEDVPEGYIQAPVSMSGTIQEESEPIVVTNIKLSESIVPTGVNLFDESVIFMLLAAIALYMIKRKAKTK